MSRITTKPVLGVSDQVQHKPGCTATEDGYRLEISDLGSRGIHCIIYVAKTKALISWVWAVTYKLISAAAYARSMFSYDTVHADLDSMNNVFLYLLLYFVTNGCGGEWGRG